jgi:hypothetical protein
LEPPALNPPPRADDSCLPACPRGAAAATHAATVETAILLAITSAAGSEGTFPTNWGFPGCARERTRRFAGAGVGKESSWLAWRKLVRLQRFRRLTMRGEETCWRELALFTIRAISKDCLPFSILFQNNVGVF